MDCLLVSGPREEPCMSYSPGGQPIIPEPVLGTSPRSKPHPGGAVTARGAAGALGGPRDVAALQPSRRRRQGWPAQTAAAQCWPRRNRSLATSREQCRWERRPRCSRCLRCLRRRPCQVRSQPRQRRLRSRLARESRLEKQALSARQSASPVPQWRGVQM